jgi:hypothetical protein
MWDGMTLIPGRECGDCTVCCTAPSINKPEIQKLSGAACRHCTSLPSGGGGCAIYDETEGISEDFDLETGIGLMLVGNPLKIVRQRWFQDFVVTGVTSSVPLFLSLPGPRGHQAATVSLNTEQMLDAIARGDIKDALEAALKILRGWDYQPAVITYTGNDVSVSDGG